MPGRHTSKQKRQARHVADSERARGESPDEAERIGWATVNARKSLSFQPHKMRPRDSVAHTDHGMYSLSPKHELHYVPRDSSSNTKKLGKFESRVAAIAHADAHHASVGKGFRLTSIDDYYDSVTKSKSKSCDGCGDDAQGEPKKLPRDLSPSSRMRPVSDDEALGRRRKDARAGKKSLRWLAALKALATGYSKVAGGGALKAANRAMPLLGPNGRPGRANIRNRTRSSARPRLGPDGRRGRLDDKADFGGRSRKIKRAETLAVIGYHRPGDEAPGITKGSTVANTTNFNDLFKSELSGDVLCDCPHCDASITKSDLSKARDKKKRGKSGAHVSEQNPQGGEMRGDGRGVHKPTRGVPGAGKHDPAVGVQNSKGSHARKGEVDDDGDDEGIEKAGETAAGGRERQGSRGGATGTISGAAVGRTLKDARQGSSPGKDVTRFGITTVASKPSSVSHGERERIRAKREARKGIDDDEALVDDDALNEDAGDEGADGAATGVAKKSITIRGTEFVHYIDDGSDAALAKSIAEGVLGGTSPTRPLDMNNDLTRLLI